MITSNKRKFNIQKHPNPRLQTAWSLAQWGLIFLPILPTFAAFSLIASLASIWSQNYQKIIKSPINKALGILSILLIGSSALAMDRGEAFLGLINFLPFFIFFATFSTLIQTPNQLRRIAWILVLTSIPVVILGIGQIFWGWQGSFSLHWLFGWSLEPTGNPRATPTTMGRMASVFMYANILSCYLLMVFPLAIGLWLEEWIGGAPNADQTVNNIVPPPIDQDDIDPRLIVRQPVVSHEHKSPLPWLTIAIIGLIIALIFTNARSAWGISILGILAFSIYLGWRWLAIVILTPATLILLSAFGPNSLQQMLRKIVPSFFWARLTDEMYNNRPLASLRTTQWRFAANLIKERPISGWGLRNFTPIYEKQMAYWLGHPHNAFLMLGAETGLPATLLLCAVVGWILTKSTKLFLFWQEPEKSTNSDNISHDNRLIFFSYLVAFFSCIIFNLTDVSLFDLRLNVLGWLLLASLWGVVTHFSKVNKFSNNEENL